MSDLAPMPADFEPRIDRESVRGSVVWVWRDTLIVEGMPVKLEYGLRHEDRDAMRQKIWDIHEHARLGHHQHLSHVRQDRHQKRPRREGPSGLPIAQSPA